MNFIQHAINGLLQGSMLALMALGFSLVWGILHIVNLSHAATIMLAAYLSYFRAHLRFVKIFADLLYFFMEERAACCGR